MDNFRTMAEITADMTEANMTLVEAEKVAAGTRAIETTARNRVNELQKEFDVACAKLRSTAPRGTDWQRVLTVRSSVALDHGKITDADLRVSVTG